MPPPPPCASAELFRRRSLCPARRRRQLRLTSSNSDSSWNLETPQVNNSSSSSNIRREIHSIWSSDFYSRCSVLRRYVPNARTFCRQIEGARRHDHGVRMRMRRGHGIDRKCGGLQFRIHCRNLVLCVCVCPCVCAGARARKSRDNKRGRILSTIDGSQPRSTALSMHITSSIKKIQKQC